MKTIKVITTVGTSLIENARTKNYLAQANDEYNNIKKAEYYQSWKAYDGDGNIETVKVAIRPFFDDFSHNDISAEIKSLVKIQEQEGCKLEVYLICTDTILSVVAADMIKEWFEGKEDYAGYDPNNEKFTVRFEHTEEYIIRDLRIDSQQNYEIGFMRLIEVIDKIADKSSLLNITGGYKAIIPILTLLGQLKEIPLKYIYEDANNDEIMQPIEIGNLPINFDWGVIHYYYPYYTSKSEFELNLLSEIEKLDMEKISNKYKIFRFDKREQKYKRTIIGSLLNTYAHLKSPDSIQVVGFFVEYKFYEYFQNLYKNQYSLIERDYPHNPESDIKYDVYLKNTISDFMLVECKSSEQIFNAFEKKQDPRQRNTYQQIVNQFEKDFSDEMVIFPKEYHLYFYFYGKKYPDMKKVQDNLDTIGKYIHDFTKGDTKLVAKYIELNVNLEKDSDNNQFKSFMANPFDAKKVILIPTQ